MPTSNAKTTRSRNIKLSTAAAGRPATAISLLWVLPLRVTGIIRVGDAGAVVANGEFAFVDGDEDPAIGR